MVAYSRLNVTEDTSEGSIDSGGDITAALQEAASGVRPDPGHFRNLFLPPGIWELSDTVVFPYRDGGKFLGEGPTDAVLNSSYDGVGTVIKPSSSFPDDGRPLLHFRGVRWEFGDFTIWGNGTDTTGIAIGKTVSAGIGTGKMIVQPIRFEACNIGIQLKTPADLALNTDNIQFERLNFESCTRGLEMNHVNAMDVVISKLRCAATTYAIYVNGGGFLHVEHALFTFGTQTCLYIPEDASVGNNNGLFKLSNVKVDSTMGNNFCMVNDLCKQEHQIHIDGALISPSNFDGNFATITGSTLLTINRSSGSFKSITGVEAELAGVPTTPLCKISNSFMERDPEYVFYGDIDYRIEDCKDSSNAWRDNVPARTAIYIDSELFSTTDGAVADIVVE